MQRIYFSSCYSKPIRIAQSTQLKQFIELLFIKEQTKMVQVRYVFCSDSYLLAINQEHLQHDYYTDIITFRLNEPQQPILGEIYISIDRIRDNAKHFSVAFKDELLRVMFHGALHLCGYDDHTAQDIALMRNKEDRYLREWKSIT